MKLFLLPKIILTTIAIIIFVSSSYSQLDLNSKKTIENIFFGVKLNDEYLSVYNALNDQPECYDIEPRDYAIFAKAKKSKTFKIDASYSFPYIGLTYFFENKKLRSRMIWLSEEITDENYKKIKGLLTIMATSSTFQDIAERSRPEESVIDFLDKSGKIFAQILYKQSFLGNKMDLKVRIYDFNIL